MILSIEIFMPDGGKSIFTKGLTQNHYPTTAHVTGIYPSALAITISLSDGVMLVFQGGFHYMIVQR